MKMTFACSFPARLKGLLGKSSFDGILAIIPCRSIHTFGMKFAIDACFINGDGIVVETRRNIPPGKRAACRSASFVLERRANESASWPEKGDALLFEPEPDPPIRNQATSSTPASCTLAI